MKTSSQKIIVIDDQFDEVQPLLKALWKQGMSCLYLDGLYESLPDKPYVGVRLLFLDIEIETKGNTDANMASALAARVERVIGTDPCPYFIVFWTKNNDQIKQVIKYLKGSGIAPIGYLDFEKPLGNTNENLITDLFSKIDSELGSLGSFNYLLDWESKIDESAIKFSNNFFSLINADGDERKWSEDTSSILANLACAHTGSKVLSCSCEDNIRNAFLMLGESFKDTLDANIKNTVIVRNTLVKKPLDAKYLSEMNKALFLDYMPEQKPSIGNVYIKKDSTNDALFKGLSKDILKSKINSKNCEVVGMIITPSCDLATDKNFMYDEKNDIGHYRILHGLLIPFTDETYIYLKGLNSDALFLVQPFWNPESKSAYIIVFHFGTLTSKWMPSKKVLIKATKPKDETCSNTEENSPVATETTLCDEEIQCFSFRLKELLVFDIQSKMSSHANRLGNTMLGF